MKLKEIFLAGLLCSAPSWAQEANVVSEDELVAAAERMIAQEQELQAETAKDAKVAETKSEALKNESEIPAFRNKEAVKSVETGSWQRIFLSAAVVMMFAGGLFYGVKRFAKRASVQDQKLRMDVISQHHFSPKRSLMVVRVAGEYLLIGATDHSLNLIKTISLIDDEVSDALPQDFNNFLEDEFVQKRTLNV